MEFVLFELDEVVFGCFFIDFGLIEGDFVMFDYMFEDLCGVFEEVEVLLVKVVFYY